MPTISMFYGIIIRMYYNDHMPPHFHAEYQGWKAVFDLSGNLLEGDFPKARLNYVQAWADIHHDELLANWELAKAQEELYRIEPLK